MMKIGILTCHDVYNYGATLQAYALCKYLNTEAGQAELINYEPEYLYRLIDFMRVDAPRWQKNFITRWCYRIYVFPNNLQMLRKYINYKRFNKKYLRISSPKIKNNGELKFLNKWDICICGSDQIWNSATYPLGEDSAYFLEFHDGTKIAYAASFGGKTVSELGRQNISAYLPKFKAVSVREKSAVEILKQFGINAVHVVDPVFLISKNEWEKLAKRPKGVPEKYILAYGYDNSEEFSEAVSRYSEMTGLPVVSSKTRVFRNAGPQEFIYLVKSASMVITTSFHATAFSVILHKPFTVAKTQNEDLFERIESILDMSGLENRKYSELKDRSNWNLEEKDFDNADNRMREYTEYSKQFLNAVVKADDKTR